VFTTATDRPSTKNASCNSTGTAHSARRGFGRGGSTPPATRSSRRPWRRGTTSSASPTTAARRSR
jgi:hypothetical protein